MASAEAVKSAPYAARWWLRTKGRRASGTVKVRRKWCPGRARASRRSNHTRPLWCWHCGQWRLPQERNVQWGSPHWVHV